MNQLVSCADQIDPPKEALRWTVTVGVTVGDLARRPGMSIEAEGPDGAELANEEFGESGLAVLVPRPPKTPPHVRPENSFKIFSLCTVPAGSRVEAPEVGLHSERDSIP